MAAIQGIAYLLGQAPDAREQLESIVIGAGWAAVPVDAQTLLDTLKTEEPGCILVELGGDNRPGLDVLERLNEKPVGTPVIITSDRTDVATAVCAMKRGATDFVERPIDAEDLTRRLARALRLDRERLEEQAEARRIASRLTRLTPRQRQLLDQIIVGMSNKQIAAEWTVSERTVANHRANLLSRMRAVNTADLVRMAMEARRVEV